MYAPLYVKTNYSLLSSMLSIDTIITYCKENNISYCAISDINMYGVMEFIHKCRDNAINPILALSIKIDNNELVIYAKNYAGYKNMIKLSTIQNERLVCYEDLEKYNTNLIAVLPFSSRDTYELYSKIYKELYLGFTNKWEEEEAKNITSNIVFFREMLYLSKNDKSILPYLYLIRDGKTISDDIFYDIDNHELSINNIDEYTSSLGIKGIEYICNNCRVEFPDAEILLPIYKCEHNMTSEEYLTELSKAGLIKRLSNEVSLDYQKRLQYELDIICKMGFANYFLVVYDFIRYAKKNSILVGPGRGSAAGSLVAYSLGITDIDPIKYDLLFERFLNPERKTMPDIDTDFPDNKRDQVIDYVVSKYGKKNVCGIITFGTLGAKQVIRDVSRVLNIPLYKVDGLCKFIPAFTKEKLTDFYEKNKSFRARIESDSTLQRMYDIATKLEGFPRHTSSHAAGIIMCKYELDEVIPLSYNEGMYLTSYSMEYLEELGLLKMDFLGLKNLTIITNVLKDIYKNTEKKIDFNKIPLDDPNALSIFTKANTTGIFQFESTGMKNFLKRLKPNSFEDIFAAIALFRPGPAINIDSYIRRKYGEEKITYLDKSLEPILKNTYGIIIYQEQIMQLARAFAGYSLGEADILRRAMSKKKVALLKNEEEKFIRKSMEKGHSYDISKKIFDLVLNFAGYGFNRSHSVAYSLIAYKMAYLKAYYKEEFFSNLLTNVIGSESKTKEYILEAKSNDISVLKPDINLSCERYIVNNGKIIYPFSNIKSVGIVASRAIINARSEGMFIDIYDAFSRLYIAGVGRKTIESLIYADAFSCFLFNKKTLIQNFDSLFNYAELTKDLDPSLVMRPDIIEYEEYDNEFLLEQEQNVFGFYLSHHPITKYQKENPNCISLIDIEKYFNKVVDVLILVEKVKVINTKKGDKMSFVTGSDETGSANFTLFPKVYANFSDLERGDLIKVRGRVEKRLDDYQIIVDKLKYLKEKESIDEER